MALYRRLVRDRRGVDAQAVVLRFGPSLQETRVSDADAEALVRDAIEPLVAAMPGWLDDPQLAPATSRTDLCPTCPMRDACGAEYPVELPPRDHPPATACRPDAETGRDTVGRGDLLANLGAGVVRGAGAEGVRTDDAPGVEGHRVEPGDTAAALRLHRAHE